MISFLSKPKFARSFSKFNSKNFSTKPVNPLNPFVGVWPIIATPFDSSNESINYSAYENIINFFSNTLSTNGLTIIGVLGESNRITEIERRDLIRIACEISCKPICVGTSHPGTNATIKLSEQAFDIGAHSVMIAPSKEANPEQHSIILEYYTNICKALPDANAPIVVQDHPASTQVLMSLHLLQEIAERCSKNVKCIKLESVPTPLRIQSLLSVIREQQKLDINIMTGLGALYAMFDLEAGSDGFMTGFAFPEVLEAMYDAYAANDFNLAFDIYCKYLPIIVYEQQPGIAIRKEIYRLRGLLSDTHVRHPGKNIHQFTKQQLDHCIRNIFHDQLLTKRIEV